MAHNEDTIVARLKEKDGVMLNYLYDLHGPSLYGVILNIVKRESVATEVLQQTFMSVWNDIEFYNSKKFRLFTWMMHISFNLAKEHNHIQGSREYQQVDVIKSGLPLMNTVAEAYQERSNNLLDKLLPEHKQVLYLVYFDGCSYTEIMEALNLPPAVVKTRIRAALIKLHEIL